jgi:hypothetical protein
VTVQATSASKKRLKREELARLRRESWRLKEERKILAKAAAWLANEKPATPKRQLPCIKDF